MRNNFLSWEEYFMGVAVLSSKRSKDPVTQVGACIVNSERRIVGIGYNGFPKYCRDEDFPWEKTGEFLDTKYPYVVHAEVNAILNSTTSLKGCTLYVSLFPCNECAKLIIQSGISEIVFMSSKHEGSPSDIASKKMLNAAGISYRQFKTMEVKIEC